MTFKGESKVNLIMDKRFLVRWGAARTSSKGKSEKE
jgi:hypothetical protein